MSNQNNCYKYQTDGDISKELFESLNDYLLPFFKSYQTDIKTFIVQTVNLVLAFILLYFLIDWFLDLFIKGIRGSGATGMKIFLLLLMVGIGSAFKKNKIFKWQTLFEMNFILAKKYFYRFIIFIAILYGIKKYISYETGNKK